MLLRGCCLQFIVCSLLSGAVDIIVVRWLLFLVCCARCSLRLLVGVCCLLWCCVFCLLRVVCCLFVVVCCLLVADW